MAITTVGYSQPLLFVRPTKHLLRPFPHRLTTTLTFSSPIPKPISTSFKKPFLITHATSLPIQPFNFLPPSSPNIPPFSQILLILFAFAKTLTDKLLVSIHEFNVPLVALANAVGKWVDLYHSVLMVRILLSWFPNMPWEKQPFSAIRDLCDPCLSFFRTIMPPTANSRIDLSPLLAFVFFGVLSNFLKTPVQ